MISILTAVRNPAWHQRAYAAWSRIQQRLREPALTLLLTLQVLAIFVAGPLASMHVLPVLVSILLDCAVIIVVLGITSPNSKAQSIIIAAVVVDAISWYACHGRPTTMTFAIDLAARIITLGTLSTVLIHTVFADDREGTYHRVQGGISIYLNIALIFAMVFRLAMLVDQHALALSSGSVGRDLGSYIYFSLSTLTTTGFGDITPVNPLVRSVANLESVIGALFPATLLARLVVRYLS